MFPFWVFKKSRFSRENKTIKIDFTFNGKSTGMNSISAEIIPIKKLLAFEVVKLVFCHLCPIYFYLK
jgi:hypothetical protein